MIPGFKAFITESVGQAGLDYELKVHKAMKDAKIVGLNAGDKPNNETAGFSNQGAGDIEASYNGNPFNIEIKSSAKDQMGGGSFVIRCKVKSLLLSKR